MIKALISRPILANLLMLFFIIGGVIMAGDIRKEFLPNQPQGTIQVAVSLEGASPSEIQSSILLVVEDSVRGLDGVKRVTARAQQGLGIVTVVLLEGANPTTVLQNVKNVVDRIQSLPTEAERPEITLVSDVDTVMSLVLYGDQDELTLREFAEQVRDDLRSREDITRAEITNPRPLEVSVDLTEVALRQYGLTLEEVSSAISRNAVERSGGTIRDASSDFVLRTDERRLWAEDFADISILESDNGQNVRLGDIADLEDGFGLSPVRAWYNGQPAIQIDVYAVGNESPISVEQGVIAYLDGQNLPDTLAVTIFENDAQAYRDRLYLLVDNALIGLVLVFIILALFLEPKLAFWVMVGIPTSMLGGILILPLFGATINMISLFAFIVTIGIVVDDAIMVAESIFFHRGQGKTKLEAASDGLREMFIPILLAVGTNVIAFMPLFFIPGGLGVIFYQVPAVVVAILLVSLIESLLILTVHLAEDHLPGQRFWERASRPQKAVNAWLERFIKRYFFHWVSAAVRNTSLTLSSMIALLLVTIGFVVGGWIPFSFSPVLDADVVTAEAVLPFGSPEHRAIDVQNQLVEAAQAVPANIQGVYSVIGLSTDGDGPDEGGSPGTHIVSALVALAPADERDTSGVEFAEAWGSKLVDIKGLETLKVSGETSFASGEAIEIEVSHRDDQVARDAAIYLGARLSELAIVRSVDDGVQSGKPELRFSMTAQGRAMGLTADDIATQVRHRFFGSEAQRFQRGSNEVRVMVRLTEEERSSVHSLENILIRTRNNEQVPLSLVAQIDQGRAVTQISRANGRRVYSVVAEAMPNVSENEIKQVLNESFLPAASKEFPGLSTGFSGESEEVSEALSALGTGLLFVLAIIYCLMAVMFNSYIQPLVLMSVIPFGIIGAIWGHALLGYEVSIISFLGIIALIGVLMNDSLVLMMTANRYVQQGSDLRAAAIKASCRRLRPVLLTSFTTFAGLAPMLFETSMQARFLIPMAISICFGLLFATIVVLFLIPALYAASLTMLQSEKR